VSESPAAYERPARTRTWNHLDTVESGALQQAKDVIRLVESEAMLRDRQRLHRGSPAEADNETAVHAQHAPQFAQSDGRIGPEVDGVDRAGLGEAIGVVGKTLDARAAQLDSSGSNQRGEALRAELGHVRREVDPGDEAFVDKRRDAVDKVTRAEADLDHLIVGSES
jgi:hypothetical protein